MGVGYGGYILSDDGSCIQFLGYVMARGANNLYPSFKSGMVRFRSCKGRKEGMVDIDDLVGIHTNKLWGYDLHIACENDKINLMCLQERKLFIFCSFSVGNTYRDMVKGQFKLFGYAPQLIMVAQDKGDFHFQFP